VFQAIVYKFEGKKIGECIFHHKKNNFGMQKKNLKKKKKTL